MKNIVLRFLSTTLNFQIAPEVDFSQVKDFFNTHFQFQDAAPEPEALATIHITFETTSEARENRLQQEFEGAERNFIRKSHSEFFSIPILIHRGVPTRIFCTRSRTTLTLHPEQKRIDVQVTDRPYLMDLVELVRDLVLKHEENQGALVLHSTVVHRNGKVGLVIGKKGAGKTTTALELVKQYGYTFMSGDKAIITSQNGVLQVVGWPDYPHLGYGTLRQHPELLVISDLTPELQQQATDDTKVALDPTEFRKLVPHTSIGEKAEVAWILFPQVTGSQQGRFERSVHTVQLLQDNIETAYGQSNCWNTYLSQNTVSLQALLEQAGRILAFHSSGPHLPADPASMLLDVAHV